MPIRKQDMISTKQKIDTEEKKISEFNLKERNLRNTFKKKLTMRN